MSTTTKRASNFESGTVVVNCPHRAARGYEFDLEPDDLNAHVSYACDDCGGRIEVVVDVIVQGGNR